MYGILWVEARYLSHFFILFWAAALMLVRLHLTNDAVQGRRAAKTQMQIAEGLLAEGVPRGPIGNTDDESQKLLAVQVVAEVQYDANSLDASNWPKTEELLRQAGATVLVA